MSSLSVGWAIGQIGSTKADEILRTADGGKSWKAVTPPEGDRSEKKAIAFFQDANRAWATFAIPPSGSPPDSFMVWRTTDGGTSWKSTLTSLAGMTMESFTVSQIAFFDASNGWLWAVNGVGMSHTYIMIYKTIDGGTTWKQVVSPDKNNLNMACSKSGVWFRDAQHGYISGNCGGVVKGLYFYKTDNGGDTWSLVTLPAPAGLPDAYSRDTNVCGADTPRFFDMQKGYILVTCRDMDASKNYRWVYSTTNGGGTWNASALPRPWGDIFFLNAETGWYLGQTASDDYSGVKVYLTLDGGKNWKEISGTQWAGRMEYLDTKNGWVIAKAASDTALVRTFDGGLTYQIINPQLAP